METDLRWLPIPGFEGRYMVSDRGHVLSLARRNAILMKQTVSEKGYRSLTLAGRLRRRHICFVHRLVLLAFTGARPAGMFARHLNSDPSDNRVANLAWGTPRQNQADRIAAGTAPRGENNPAARLRQRDVSEIRRLRSAGHRVGRIAAAFGVSLAAIEDILYGRNWREHRQEVSCG